MEGFDDAARQELIAGLSAPRAAVSPKYLYDALGCSLFESITCLPEYYPTRTELALMERHAQGIARTAGPGAALIELGAGNCRKARALFPALQPRQYVAVDISAGCHRQAMAGLQHEFPDIPIMAVTADIGAPFELPQSVNGTRRLFFYPGSSIGNFAPDAALALLIRIRSQCVPSGGLLVGVDLVKDAATLHAAYNDALGLTAAFNRNVLNHLNALIGSDFDLDDWRHQAFYNAELSRIEMHLIAVRDIRVSWMGGGRDFGAGEGIHTESSYKYRLADFEALLTQAGFDATESWTDDRTWFAVCYAGVG